MLENKEQSLLQHRDRRLNYEARAPRDPGSRIWSSYLLKQEAMTPTADCLIIYNARCRLCERVYNGSLREARCKEK